MTQTQSLTLAQRELLKELVAAKHLSIPVSNKTRSSIKLRALAARYVSNADQNHRFSSPLATGWQCSFQGQAKNVNSSLALTISASLTRVCRSSCGVWGETTWCLFLAFSLTTQKATACSLSMRHWAQTQTRGAGPNRPPPQHSPILGQSRLSCEERGRHFSDRGSGPAMR